MERRIPGGRADPAQRRGTTKGARALRIDEERRDEGREEREAEDRRDSDGDDGPCRARLVGALHAENAHVEGGGHGDEESNERHQVAHDAEDRVIGAYAVRLSKPCASPVPPTESATNGCHSAAPTEKKSTPEIGNTTKVKISHARANKRITNTGPAASAPSSDNPTRTGRTKNGSVRSAVSKDKTRCPASTKSVGPLYPPPLTVRKKCSGSTIMARVTRR